eukprot:GHVT01008513.1.p2 GENE.GHVT01008513.1~~GHVT01008513.1.p2  ORF type:complete len:199 (+),score=5.50 GHVT01008513.1:169-765(+)
MASATANPFGGSFYDPESQAVSGDWQGMDAKTARTIRHGFIRKVYGIIVAQLALTFAVAATMVSSEPVRNWSQEHALPLFVLSLVGSIGVLCYLGFKAGATQSVPSNYILLAILTVCESIAVGLICTLYGALKNCFFSIGALWIVVGSSDKKQPKTGIFLDGPTEAITCLLKRSWMGRGMTVARALTDIHKVWGCTTF